jgi:hypothetical protein
MRATPTVTITGFRNMTTGVTSTLSSVSIEAGVQGFSQIGATFSTGALTVGNGYSFGYTAAIEL